MSIRLSEKDSGRTLGRIAQADFQMLVDYMEEESSKDQDYYVEHTAIDALEGKVVPQEVKLPLAIVEDPDFKEGENFYPSVSDNFFVGNAFPTCGINFTAQEIMGQTEANQ